MNTKVIAFAGRARSGKDSCALSLDYFVSRRNVDLDALPVTQDRQTEFRRYSFADPIRAMLKAGFGIDMYDPYWIERKEDVIEWLGKSPRQLMQTLGTEWGRELVHQNLWVLLAQQNLHKLEAQAKLDGLTRAMMVIPDCRFPNERAWLDRIGGHVIHVERPGQPIASSSHASEIPVERKSHDFVIHNTGSLEDLHRAVVGVLHVIESR